MFLSYYGFEEQPFGVTPDARYLYMGTSHREALASLLYGIQTGRGFLALIAPPGMGKTTLLFQLMDQLQKSSRTVFLFQTLGNSVDFLSDLIADMGLSPAYGNLSKLQSQLNEVLIREAQLGRQFVLIIDEAQNLQDDVLETVRMLSNFETPTTKLMQIVLSGQPQLADKLIRGELTQLRQRISIICHLDPLSPEDGIRYIDNRLKVAGYKGRGPLFTPDAMRTLLDRSQGIPRNINNICFHALSIGYAKGRKTIDTSILEEVLADLELEHIGSEAGRVRRDERVPANGPTDSVPAADAAQGAPYQSTNPWYRESQTKFPAGHPLIHKKAHWVVWAFVLFVLAVAGMFIWKRAGENPRNVAASLYHLSRGVFPSTRQKAISGASNQQVQTHSGSNNVDPARRNSPQGAKALATAVQTPESPLRGSKQPGNNSLSASQANGSPKLPTSSATGVDPQHREVDATSENGSSSSPGGMAKPRTVPSGNRAESISDHRSGASANHDFGELVMRANMRGARVFINGQSDPGWVTPHTFSLTPGTYWIEVSKYGHSSWYGSVHISKGKTRWAVADLGRSSGAILIETVPSQIPVYIDGEAYGPSPVESTLLAGRHTYKVIPQNGAEPYTGSFILKPADILRIRVKWPTSRRPGMQGTSGQSEVPAVGLPPKGGHLEQKF